MKITKRVKAPVRIDFGGGTTDISPFRDIYGGCVLNAAINRYVFGKLIIEDKKTKLFYSGDIPTSSGLGTSSTMNLVWLALISKIKNKDELAEAVFRIEQSIQESKANGKQDMYCAAYGGINFMEFKKDEVLIKSLNLNRKIIQKLENHLVLVYSGKSHYSGSSNKAIINNLLEGKNTKNLLRIKEIARKMKDSLLEGDLQTFADLMNAETEERKKLSKITLSPVLKSIIETGKKNGAIAAKICGSGGGGSILFFAENRRKLLKRFGERVLSFKFDFEGLKWLNH